MLRLNFLAQLGFLTAIRASLMQEMKITADEESILILGRSFSDAIARRRCRRVMQEAPSSIGTAMHSSDLNVCEDFEVTELYQANFNDGTYIIKTPGIYRIMENIVMAPDTQHMMPAKESTTYPLADGYWLGFFAAIAVASDNVFLDLNKKSISMSQEFLMRQRFFSVIQLGERPFKANVGPPQFNSLQTEPVCASNVVISDGQLGMSSHMGVHGVDNNNIWIDHVKIRDFETGGIQINGVRNIHITDTKIGPSLGHRKSAGSVPGLATLSQAQLLLRIVEGEQIDGHVAFQNLRASVERYIGTVMEQCRPRTTRRARQGREPGRRRRAGCVVADGDIGEQERIFENRAGLPDGSSLYGIVLHAAKPAIHDFASCPQFDGEDDGNAFGPVTLKDVTVKNLQLRTDEVVSMQFGDKPVMGPAGDQLQIFRCQDSDGNYVPNVLSEAQLTLGRLKLAYPVKYPESDADEVFRLFGATNIPAEVVAWSIGLGTFDSMIEQMNGKFVCQKDAMSHHNKGVVGVRIEYYDDVSLSAVKIKDLKNVGTSAEVSHCTGDEFTYSGSDARGMSLSFVSHVHVDRVAVQRISTLAGSAYGVEERIDVGYDGDGTPSYSIENVAGARGSTDHHTALLAMLATDS